MHRASVKRPAVRRESCDCENCAATGVKPGVRRGSLVVIGIHSGHGEGGEAMRWVVQCDCGAYDIRRTRTLHGRENFDDCCGFCNDEAVAFKRKFFGTHGRYPDWFEMPERKRRSAA